MAFVSWRSSGCLLFWFGLQPASSRIHLNARLDCACQVMLFCPASRIELFARILCTRQVRLFCPAIRLYFVARLFRHRSVLVCPDSLLCQVIQVIGVFLFCLFSLGGLQGSVLDLDCKLALCLYSRPALVTCPGRG